MIRIHDASGFTADELASLNQADTLANQVLASLEFEAAILGAKRLAGDPGFEGTLDTPEEVLAKYRAGDVELSVSVYSLPWWRRFSSEVAHESPDGSVSFNRRFYDSMDLASQVNTIFHETGHKLGYEHDYWRTAARPYSEPYQVGDIAEQVARGILEKAMLAQELGHVSTEQS